MGEFRNCPVCRATSREFSKVLWPELIEEWGLSDQEAAYIDRQQGEYCVNCRSSLRSMALADAILTSVDYNGSLSQFVRCEDYRNLKVLEINPAGTLGPFLEQMPGHLLVTYPEADMTNLDLPDDAYDLVLHSDTLEHVPDPLAGLSECRRVTKKGGRCIFTVPLIVERMTKSRAGLKKSYHGAPGEGVDDYLVYTEFGADAWCMAAAAGFSRVTMHNFEFPAALAIEAEKT